MRLDLRALAWALLLTLACALAAIATSLYVFLVLLVRYDADLGHAAMGAFLIFAFTLSLGAALADQARLRIGLVQETRALRRVLAFEHATAWNLDAP